MDDVEKKKISTKAQLIIEKIKGSISDEEYKEIWRVIENTEGISCKDCDDEGVVVKKRFNSYGKITGSSSFRCYCSKGSKFPKLPWFVKNK